MQQDPSLQRDELAQAHQLGELQREYTIAFGKQFAKFGVIGLIVFSAMLIMSFILGFSSLGFSWSVLIGTVIVFTCTFVVYTAVVVAVLYHYQQFHVYVYTGGLVYLRGNKKRAVRWEQMRRAYRLGVGRQGDIRIDVHDEPGILISFLDPPEMGELYATIKREVEQSSRQAGYTSPQYYQETMPPRQVNEQPSYAAEPQPPTRWRRWFLLGTLGTLILGGFIAGFELQLHLPTPTGTLNVFCSALKSGDYQAAYTQLSSGLQSKIGSEAQFAAGFSGNPDALTAVLGKMTSCIVRNVNDAAGSGTISITFASDTTLVQDLALVNQNGAWKINGYRTRSSPTFTLISFCEDLLSQNYTAAYDQLSRSQHSQQSEAQFANLFTGNPVSTCMVSSVNDTAGTGSIARTYADGSNNTFDYTLIVEHGTWKINTRHVRP